MSVFQMIEQTEEGDKSGVTLVIRVIRLVGFFSPGPELLYVSSVLILYSIRSVWIRIWPGQLTRNEDKQRNLKNLSLFLEGLRLQLGFFL